MSRRGHLFHEIGKIYTGREALRFECYFAACAALAAGSVAAGASLLIRMP